MQDLYLDMSIPFFKMKNQQGTEVCGRVNPQALVAYLAERFNPQDRRSLVQTRWDIRHILGRSYVPGCMDCYDRLKIAKKDIVRGDPRYEPLHRNLHYIIKGKKKN